jgi:hypothetical protein
MDMSLRSEAPTGFRTITYTLERDHTPSLRLATGGLLLGYGKLKWHVQLSVAEAPKDAPWKGVAALYPQSERNEERHLHFSLKLTREEMDECWNGVLGGVIPESVSLVLREDPPAITGGEGLKIFDKTWNDAAHPHVELASASFRYAAPSSQRQRALLEAVERFQKSKVPMIVIGLLTAIFIAVALRR